MFGAADKETRPDILLLKSLRPEALALSVLGSDFFENALITPILKMLQSGGAPLDGEPHGTLISFRRVAVDVSQPKFPRNCLDGGPQSILCAQSIMAHLLREAANGVLVARPADEFFKGLILACGPGGTTKLVEMRGSNDCDEVAHGVS